MIARLACALACIAAPALADPPRVVADIAPVHALVSQVMEGVGAPDLVISPAASPHSYALRPSQARSLQQADLVVWIGPELTPWLAKPLESLASDAAELRLLDADGTVTLAYRESFEGVGHDHGSDEDHAHDKEHAHDEGHAHDEEHAHDADHAHDEEHAHGEDHAHDEEHAHEGHDHAHAGGVDPHAWLDPENGRVWLGAIAETLAGIDPGNASVYRANAAAAQADLDALQAELAAQLAPVQARPFVAFHDAYHYFEDRFGLNFAGAISLSDAVDPSPARVAAFRETLTEQGVRCAYREPQFNDRLLEAAAENHELQIGVIDPMGSDLTPGPALYAKLLRDMAQSLASCS